MTTTSLQNKLLLEEANTPLTIALSNKTQVAAHFHLTEVALEEKRFLDCGSTLRSETRAVLQVLVASDTEHRLAVGKVRSILEQSIKLLPKLKEAPLYVELTGKQSIERYRVVEIVPFATLHIEPLQTACLAPESCQVDPAQSHQALTGPQQSQRESSSASSCC